MDQIQQEMQIAKLRSNIANDLKKFIENIYPLYEEHGIKLTDAYTMFYLKSLDCGQDEVIRLLNEVFPEEK